MIMGDPHLSVADPGFPRRKCQPPRWGRQPIIWSKISQKLHENERNWTHKGDLLHAPPPVLVDVTEGMEVQRLLHYSYNLEVEPFGLL